MSSLELVVVSSSTGSGEGSDVGLNIGIAVGISVGIAVGGSGGHAFNADVTGSQAKIIG